MVLRMTHEADVEARPLIRHIGNAKTLTAHMLAHQKTAAHTLGLLFDEAHAEGVGSEG